MEDLISILIPVFNAEHTIRDCLESIVNLEYDNFEVVIVNDGSTDQSPTIIEEFARHDNRFKVFNFPDNRGIVAALNDGLTRCLGKWIARLDADDMTRPERLSLQMNTIRQNPDIDILGARVTIFRHDGCHLTPGQMAYRDWSNNLLTDEDIKRNMFAESPIMHPTFFLKKSVYHALGGYQDNPWAEDYDLLLRAYTANYTFGKVNRVLVDKRDSPGRLARVDKRCKRKAMFAAKARYFRLNFDCVQDREYSIIGSGNSGLLAKAALENEGIKISGIADDTNSTDPRKIKGTPAVYFDSKNLDLLLNQSRHPYFIICIGIPDARCSVTSILEEKGLTEEADYIRFI